MSVPKALCFESIGGSNEDKLNQIAVALCTEKAKGDDSLYRPFVDTLPDDVSYIPALWSELRLNRIKGTNIYSDCIKMRRSWENTFHTLDNDKNHNNNIGIDDYLWGRATLQGRILSFETSKSFNKVKNSDNVIYSLTPFISLPNHSDDSELYPSLSFGNTEYLLRADRNIFANNDLFITYGTMSFQQRILCFGWIDREVSSSKYSISTVAVPKAVESTDTSDNDVFEEIEIKTLVYHDPTDINHQSMLSKELASTIDKVKAITRDETGTKAVDLISTQLASKLSVINHWNQELDMNMSDEDYIVSVECIAAQNILNHLNSFKGL